VSIVGFELPLDEAAFFDAGVLAVGFVALAAGRFFIIHFLVQEERIERTKVGRLDVDVRRAGDLLSALHDRQDFFRRDGFAFRQEPSQDVIHQVQSFVLGGGRFTASREQLVVGHAEPSGRIQVVDVLVVGERARLADQRINDVAEVDLLLALPKQPRQAFQALVAVPQLEMVLVDQHVHFQTDVFAVDRIGVSLDTQDAIRLDPDTQRRERAQPLVRQRLQGLA